MAAMSQSTNYTQDPDYARLMREFTQIDKDGSGRIDKQEMDEFLAMKGIDAEHRMQIIDVVFQACDLDGSGLIELKEFVGHYIDTKNKLVEREAELTSQIKLANRMLRETSQNLNMARQNRDRKMMGLSGVLKVIVIRAENLIGA